MVTNYPRFIRDNFYVLCFATLGAVFRYFFWTDFSLEQHLWIYLLSFGNMVAIWEFFRWINLFLNKKLPFEQNLVVRISVQLGLGALFMLLIRINIFVFAERLLPIPLEYMFRLSTYVVFIILSFGINLGYFAHYFLNKWKESIQMTERLKREKTQVQFDNLKNQLNPHFLFNALSSLNSLIYEDQHLASEFLQNLSRVYRYVLLHQDKNRVSIKTELNFIEHYIFLLKTRFQNAIEIIITIKEVDIEKEIVPVSLQILIENAIKHNIVSTEQPLIIEITSEENQLVVRNNLQVKRIVDGSNKLGLDRLKTLYSFLSTKEMIIEQTNTHFVVKLPLLD